MNSTIAYLLLGHALGSVLVQHRPAPGLRPTGVRFLVHALAVAVAWWVAGADRDSRWLLLLLVIGVMNWLCSITTARLEKALNPPWATLLLDQGLRIVVLVFAASLAGHRVLPGGDGTRMAIVVTAYLMVTSLGAEIVGRLLAQFKPRDDKPRDDERNHADQAEQRRMGKTIGVLERALGLTFILLDAWSGLAGIVAAKSIARIKEFEERSFAEYFLVGTLASFLVTTTLGACTLWSLEQIR